MPTKSAISFGLVHVPIAMHTATTDNDVKFNQPKLFVEYINCILVAGALSKSP